MEIQQTSFVPPPPTSPTSAPPVDAEGVSVALLAEAALNSPKRLTPGVGDESGNATTTITINVDGVVGPGGGIPGPLSPAVNADTNMSAQEIALKKRAFVLQELLETERDYVKDLAAICEDYLPNMKEDTLPEGLQGKKDKVIFGNVQSIFEFHRDILLPDLEKYSAGFLPDNQQQEDGSQTISTSTLNLQLVFCGPRGERQRRLEYIYNVYCENKPKSEAIVGEFDAYFETLRKQLNHRLQLSDYL